MKFAMRYCHAMEKRQLGKHYLRQWREHRGLSLRKLADRMEVEPGVPVTSHANIGRVETFQQPYTQELLEAAAAALDCTVSDILTIDPTKNGEVVDLMRLINDRNRDQAIRVLKALTGSD